MSKVVKVIAGFKILSTGKDYVVINQNGNYSNHGHFKKLKTCYTIIRLVRKKTIPKREYMIEAAKRLTINEKYKKELVLKQEKNKKQQRYFNANKGVRK